MLKKIQPSKTADLIGFIKEFMNQAASHLKEGGVREALKEKDCF